MQNDTEESIPLLPWFETVLLETPYESRRGGVFHPQSLQSKIGRKVRHECPDAEWVGEVIGRIGKEAGIIVEPADERTGRPIKYATAHDLRRSWGERLREAGVPPLVICRVMRHPSLAPPEALRPGGYPEGCGSSAGDARCETIKRLKQRCSQKCAHLFMGTLLRAFVVSHCTPVGSNHQPSVP